MTSARILVVDHESKWVHLLRQILTGAGYVVLVSNNGERALQMAAEESPALVLTESCLPGELSGCDLVRRLHEFSEAPVVILSASTETEDVLSGFAAGADDYISKPFDAKILLARIHAVMKRCRGNAAAPLEINCGPLAINQAARQVNLGGTEIYLTETEYNLLLELARHQNQVLLHEHLLMAVWGPEFRSEVNYLRSYVHVLRRKLEPNPAEPRLIISRPGIGYMLVSAPADACGN